jgi:two-component system, OmpR family, KDP operon response regulator KdpE
MHLRAPGPYRVGPFALQPLVLVVAQGPEQQRFLASTLAVQGLRIVQVGLGAADLARALTHGPDVVLFDARGAADRVGVTARLRGGTNAPIFVFANAGEAARAALLGAGATECILRPSGPSELVLCARTWLRQTARGPAPTATFGPGRERIRLDRERRAIFVDGRPVHATPLECKLVAILSQNGARPVREEQIIEAIWGRGAPHHVPHLRALVRQVRQKIEPDPASPRHLVDAPGGYRLKLELS